MKIKINLMFAGTSAWPSVCSFPPAAPARLRPQQHGTGGCTGCSAAASPAVPSASRLRSSWSRWTARKLPARTARRERGGRRPEHVLAHAMAGCQSAVSHEIVIELTSPRRSKFHLSAAPGRRRERTIKGYEFYVSNDVRTSASRWPRRTGEQQNLKTVTFAPQACRFVKLKALSEINDAAWTRRRKSAWFLNKNRPRIFHAKAPPFPAGLFCGEFFSVRRCGSSAWCNLTRCPEVATARW